MILRRNASEDNFYSVSGCGPNTLDFRALMVTLPVPVVVYHFNPMETVRFVSDTFSDSFGYTVNDIPNMSAWAELTCPDPDYRRAVLRQWRDMIETHRATGACAPPIEVRITDKSGQLRDVLVGFSLQADMVIVSVQDITGMRKAEALLAEQREEAACSLTANMPAGAFTMVQRVGETFPEFTFISRRCYEMTDMTSADLGRDVTPWSSRVHPEDLKRWLALMTADIDRTAPCSFDTRFLLKDGTRWLRAEAVPRTLPDGSTLWEGVLVDITTLKETEARLLTVIDASNAMTWHYNIASNKLLFNEKWTATHGHQPAKTIITLADWALSLHPDDVATFRVGYEKLLSGDVSQYSTEYRRRHVDGHYIWLRVHAGVSARDANGVPTELSGVSFDISEEIAQRQRVTEEKSLLREDLQRAQQRDTIAQVAGKVAHDLNNLISVISGTADMLDDKGLPEMKIGLDRIKRAVRMANDLVGGLGGLARPDQPRETFSLGAVFVDAVEMLGTRRSVTHGVRIDVPSTPPVVWGNLTELAQVIVNLAINACESGTPDRPATVTLAAAPAGTQPPPRSPDAGKCLSGGPPLTVFTISDTGLGITPDVRARMFRPHFTTKGLAGTGLGLPIVSSILEENNAALWVDSVPGNGTVITVAWPTAAAVFPASMDRSRRGAQFVSDGPVELPALDGMHVLVVDDLFDVGAVLADMLETAGAVVVSESDPHEARDALAEAPHLWSVLVTDLHMSGTDGRDLARFAATLTPPVPVVLVTARAETLNDSEADLFSSVLSKPVTSRMLAYAVKSASRAVQAPQPFAMPSR